MNYRYMRMILFFDLPVGTSSQRRRYRKFVNGLKHEGFLMLQESVYCKLAITLASAKFVEARIKRIMPDDGKVFLIKITEKQFGDMTILLGENKSEIINTDERYIEI